MESMDARDNGVKLLLAVVLRYLLVLGLLSTVPWLLQIFVEGVG